MQFALDDDELFNNVVDAQEEWMELIDRRDEIASTKLDESLSLLGKNRELSLKKLEGAIDTKATRLRDTVQFL